MEANKENQPQFPTEKQLPSSQPSPSKVMVRRYFDGTNRNVAHEGNRFITNDHL
jgi:hypothetical protein